MESRYLYRGKRIENGEWNGKWVEGHYYEFIGKSYIFEQPFTSGNLTYEVDPSTICQCTGLKDKNGKLIWENDILHNGNYFVVKWNAHCARFDIVLNNLHNIPIGKWEPMSCDWKTNDFKEYRKDVDYEVIGNMIDNPELLKGVSYDGE